jgi:hypothetical protein
MWEVIIRDVVILMRNSRCYVCPSPRARLRRFQPSFGRSVGVEAYAKSFDDLARVVAATVNQLAAHVDGIERRLGSGGLVGRVFEIDSVVPRSQKATPSEGDLEPAIILLRSLSRLGWLTELDASQLLASGEEPVERLSAWEAAGEMGWEVRLATIKPRGSCRGWEPVSRELAKSKQALSSEKQEIPRALPPAWLRPWRSSGEGMQ